MDIETSLLDEVQEMARSHFDLMLTHDGLRELLTPSLVGEMAEFGADDTEVRGQFANVLAGTLVGHNWPTFGDGLSAEQHEAFERSVEDCARARGWLQNQER
jgi:hypothetical protein